MELDSMDVDFALTLVEELEDRADTSSSIYIDNNGKDILILGKGPKQVLGQRLLAAEKILQKRTQNFVWVCIIMGQTVTCLLMVQNFTNLKQKTLWLLQIFCA